MRPLLQSILFADTFSRIITVMFLSQGQAIYRRISATGKCKIEHTETSIARAVVCIQGQVVPLAVSLGACRVAGFYSNCLRHRHPLNHGAVPGQFAALAPTSEHGIAPQDSVQILHISFFVFAAQSLLLHPL